MVDFSFEDRFPLFLFLGLAVFSAWLFSDIIWTVFTAVTAAYILHPVNKKLKSKGLNSEISTIITSIISFLILVALALPFIVVFFRRIGILTDFLMDLPQEIEYELLGELYVVEVDILTNSAIELLRGTAIELAASFPTLVLKLSLVVMLIYTLLRDPEAIKDFCQKIFEPGQMKILERYNRRIKKTLKGLYVIQFTSAALTFLAALPVFYLLGYEPFIALALISGLLQLLPVVGPVILILGLAGFEFAAGNNSLAIYLIISGLSLIAFIPDMLVRYKLADRSADINPGLYFLGFVGGVLGIGAIGVIVGPLTIALILETLEIFSEKDSIEE